MKYLLFLLFPFWLSAQDTFVISGANGGGGLVGASQITLSVSGGNGVIGAGCSALLPCQPVVGYGNPQGITGPSTCVGPGGSVTADTWWAAINSSGGFVCGYVNTAPTMASTASPLNLTSLSASSTVGLLGYCTIGTFTLNTSGVVTAATTTNGLNSCPINVVGSNGINVSSAAGQLTVSNTAGSVNPACTFVATNTGCTTPTTNINVSALNIPSANSTSLILQCYTIAAGVQTRITDTATITSSGGIIATVVPAFTSAAAAGYCTVNFSAGAVGPPGATGATGPTSLTENSQSTAYTTVLGDAGGFIYHPASDNNARTFTIAANASVAYPIGTTITFVNMINTLTIAITSDTLTWGSSSGSRSLTPGSMATAIKVGTTQWVISGSGLS